MFKFFFDFINSLFPYKTKNKTNKIYIIKNGVKKELKHKIKGLNINYGKRAKENTIVLSMPLLFKNTIMNIYGTNGKIFIEKSFDTINQAQITIDDYGEVYIKKNSRITMPNLKLLANNSCKDYPAKIVIGENAQIGENVIIRASDGHSIYYLEEEMPFNAPQDIIIGDNVWIGERAIILKGSTIPNNTIIGTCAVVNKKFNEENSIIAGIPAKVVKRGIRWERTNYGKFIRKHMENLAKDKSKFDAKKLIIKRFKYKFKKLLNLH